MRKQLGSTTFTVYLHTEDYGSENAGECCWTLSVADLRRIFAVFPKLETFAMIPDAIGDATENGEAIEGKDHAETLADLIPEQDVSIRDADAGIVLIRAMAEIGGEWSITWTGENTTWFFHDWDHATHDTDVTANGPEISGIDGESERRAQVNGARDALRNGVSIDDVCTAIVSILEEYERRFKYSLGSIWSDVFQGFEVAK